MYEPVYLTSMNLPGLPVLPQNRIIFLNGFIKGTLWGWIGDVECKQTEWIFSHAKPVCVSHKGFTGKKMPLSFYWEMNTFAMILKDSLPQPLWLYSAPQPRSSQFTRRTQDELFSDNAKAYNHCGKSRSSIASSNSSWIASPTSSSHTKPW